MFPNLKMSSGSLYINDEYVGQAIPEIPPLDLADPPEYVRSLHFPLSTEAEFTIEAEIDAPKLYEVLDIPPTMDAQTFSVQYQGAVEEQVRRHKKKRINKKWAKRYGYRTVYRTIRLDNVEFYKNWDNTWTIYGDYPPRIVR